MRLMTMVEIPDRNMAIAPPERMECRPMSVFLNPSFASPMTAATARSRDLTWSDWMVVRIPSSDSNAHNLVSSLLFR